MSSGGSKTTVSTNSPPAYAAPGLKTVATDAQKIYTGANNPFTPFAGSTVVPFSQQTQQSLNQQQGMATGAHPLIGATQQGILGNLQNNGINPTAQAGIAGLQDYASGKYVDGGSPAFNRALDYQSQATADDVNRQFSGMGRYGSGAQTGVLSREIGNQRDVAMQGELARQQGLQQQAAGQLIGAGQGGNANMLQAAALAPQADQFGYAPAERLAQVGGQYEDLAARNLQDQMEKYTGTQQAPLQNLQAYSDFLNGVSRGYGTNTTVGPKVGSTAQGVLGGALGGATAGSSFGPYGTAIGGGLGGLLGLFS